MAPKSKARKATRKRSPANPTKRSSHEDNSFTIFNKLPTEIRLMIWKDALPGPRIVHVKMGLLASTEFRHRCVQSERIVQSTSQETWPGNEGYGEYLRDGYGRDVSVTMPTLEEDNGWDNDDDLDSDNRPDSLWGFRTRCPIPAMLLACRESYNIASKVYSRVFGSKAALPTTWFNFQQDILYFNQETFEDIMGGNPAAWLQDAIKEEFSKLDIARVQNLAICCDDLFATDYKLWLIPTFADFGYLKTFTAVLQDYEPVQQRGLKLHFGLSGRASLVFTELINMRKACEVYRHPEKYDRFQDLEISPRLQEFNFDIQQLIQHRKEWIEMGLNTWEMPEIDSKVVTTASAIEEMEDLKQKFIKARVVSYREASTRRSINPYGGNMTQTIRMFISRLTKTGEFTNDRKP